MNIAKVEKLNDPVASNLERIIEEKGLKQKFVAQKSGIPERKLNAMLNGRCIIKACQIAQITLALNISPNDLFEVKQ